MPLAEPSPAPPPPVPEAPPSDAALAPSPLTTTVDVRGEPPPPAAHRGARTHDGFYFRLAGGFGVYEESLQSENSEIYEGEVQGRTMGLASVSELALGGTIGRGLVLGGGVYSAELVTATFRADEDSPAPPPSELDPSLRNVSILGPFLDWYPNPKNGLHFQLALGLASMSAGFPGTGPGKADYAAFGGGVVLGAGYEWWIGDEWSVGALARVMGVVAAGKDDADVIWTHTLGTRPSLLLTLTYH